MTDTRALYVVDSDVPARECVADPVRSAGLTAKTLAPGRNSWLSRDQNSWRSLSAS
jgi:hypothetical protein